MKRLDHLLPFLTLLMVFAMLLMMTDRGFGATISDAHSQFGPGLGNKICSFKLQTSKKGHLKYLIPAGNYRIIGERATAGYAYGNFQRLQTTRHGKVWKTLGETSGGSRLTVSLKNNRDTLYLYFVENRSRPGSCVLAGSLHGWL